MTTRRPVVVRGGAGRGILELGSLDRSGAYRVEGGDMSPLVFTVNADRRDSALSPADSVALRSWWQPLHCTVESSAEARERKSSREVLAIVASASHAGSDPSHCGDRYGGLVVPEVRPRSDNFPDSATTAKHSPVVRPH